MLKSNIKNYLLEFPNYFSLFLFSFFMMSLSPVLLDVSKFFNITPEKMNLVMTFFLIGEGIGIIALIYLNRKFEKRNLIIWSYIAIIPIMLALMLATSITLFYILYFLAGCFFGVIFLNANLSMLEGKVKNKDSIVNLGHGFFAIGALASPFVVSILLKNQVSWKMIYIVIICLILVSFALHLFIIRRKKVGLLAESKAINFKRIFKYRRKNIYMILTSVLMFFYVISEVVIFSWAPTFFRVEKLFSLIDASLVVSFFWIGILAGRLVISFLSYRIKAGTLLIILSLISLTGLSCAIFVNSQIVNFIGIGLTGIGFSGIPPILISSAGKIFGSGKEISLTILFVIGIIGGSAIPFVITLLSGYGSYISMLIVVISMVVFFIMVFVRKAYRKTLKTK